MNSHIQMPRTILKRFEDSNCFLYYICFQDSVLSVKKGHAKTLNTQEGYYSEETEELLSKEVERHLDKTIKHFENIDGETCTIPSDVEQHAFLYLYSLLARSSYFMESYSNTPRDCILKTLFEKDKIIVFLKKTHRVSFIKNVSDAPFVLPTGGIFQMNTDLVCPLTPNTALHFYSNEEFKFSIIKDSDIISKLNLEAFHREYQHDRRYIVSNDRVYLSSLLDKWNNQNKESL